MVKELKDIIQKLSKDHENLDQVVGLMNGKRKDEIRQLIEDIKQMNDDNDLRSDDLNSLKVIVAENEKELKKDAKRIDTVENTYIENVKIINNVSRSQNERIEKTNMKALEVEKKVLQIEARVNDCVNMITGVAKKIGSGTNPSKK